MDYQKLAAKNISPEKYEKFLEKTDKKKKRYVEKIVENLIYIETDQLVKAVGEAFGNFAKLVPKYNLYIPPGKIGSEHFLLLQLKDQLNPIKVIVNAEKIDNDYPILIIDDAIYSSHNICAHIDEYRFNTGCKNIFFVVVGFLSCRDVELIRENSYFNAQIIPFCVCDSLLPYKLFAQFDDYNSDFLYEKFGCEGNRIIPIYFEHKLGGPFSTYQFIEEIIDKPVSRKVIDNITKGDIEMFIERFSRITK